MLPSKPKEKREMKSLSDQELMRLVQAGDFSPASEIYDRYSSRIYNFAYRFLRNSEAAEDATQEVFVKMLKHANQFHGDAKLSTWLFSITANWCRDYLRKSDNKAKEAEDVLLSLPAPSELAPDRRLEQRENEQRIQKALTALTPEQQQEIARFKREVGGTRTALRNVQHSLRKDIDALGAFLAFVNIALVPILVAAFAIGLALLRRRRRARAIALQA